MKKFVAATGIGLLIGTLTPFLVFSIAILLLEGVNPFDRWVMPLILLYSIIGSVFGIIGSLMGNYTSNSNRGSWIGSVISTGIYIGLFIVLFIIIPCPLLGGC